MLTTARVAVLTAPRQLHFEQRSLPVDPLPADAVLAETLVSAISPGTETAAWLGSPPLRPGKVYPRLVGYCNVARVLRCGESCTRLKPGDRILSFASHCSHFVVREAELLSVVPDSLDSTDAVRAYLFHLGYSSVLSAGLPAGANAIVVGLGVLGVTTAAMACLAGWNVAAVSSHPPLVPLNYLLPHLRLFSRSEPPAEAQAQVVIVTTNTWADWDLALRLAGQRGQIVVLGFPGRSQPSIPFNPLRSCDFYQRQLRILAAGMCSEQADARGFTPFNEQDNIRRILDWFADGRLNPALLRIEVQPAERLAELYDQLSSAERSVHTYLLEWPASGRD